MMKKLSGGATKAVAHRAGSTNQFKEPSLTAGGKRLAAFLASSALILNPLSAFASDILPTGGSVAAGDVDIGASDKSMTIIQGSDKAIVNWNTFSIGENNSVTFVQPNASSSILNRVTSSATSTLAGSLGANGQVYLINPNGVAITATGTVKVGGGFVASTLNIADDDFLNGNLNFKGNGASAGVSNEGVIIIGREGYAALIGGTVKNDGLVAVPMGKIGLGAGEEATLDLSGDGFLQVALPSADGIEGDGALIENSGTLSANGGTVVMTAATAREAARRAINMSGLVEANSVSGRNGSITLGGGAGGSVRVSGKVTTFAKLDENVPVPTPRPDATGGAITVTGQSIELAGAEIDASGTNGGGSINIGGLKHGATGLQTAKTVSMDATSTIRADATVDGDGGNVVVWSDDLTTFDGLITARGAGTGHGGDTEVSGKAKLAYTGYTALSGPGGFGTLLLDPYNLTISSAADSGLSGFDANADDSVLNANTLTTALGGANVAVTTGSAGSQNGDITVAADVAWSTDTTLTLDAANAITINADITATGTNAGLTMTYGGEYRIASGKAVTLSGANATLDINGQSYDLIHSMAELDAIDTTGLSGYYALADNLDASGSGTFTEAVIGISNAVNEIFDGTFAGLGHSIDNLTIDTGGYNYGGLFGAISSNGSVRDIGLNNVDLLSGGTSGALAGLNMGDIFNTSANGSVTASGLDAGGLVGNNSGLIGQSSSAILFTATAGGRAGGLVGGNSGFIDDSHATGDVSIVGVISSVGGLVGSNGRSITNSYATGNVSGGNYTGGLVGYGQRTSVISNSYSTGDVSGGSSVGGLAGQSGSIDGSYATGKISGTGSNVAGLVGYSLAAVTNSYATGDVTAGAGYAGGLIAEAASTVSNSYATGNVSTTGGGTVGGLVAAAYDTVSQSYATGNVSAVSGWVGGLIGEADAAVTDSYATGDVSGTTAIGGLIGYLYGGAVTNSYAKGKVTGGSDVGGVVGYNDGGTFSDLFWDADTSGNQQGVGSEPGATSVTGLTTAEFADTAGFKAKANGWDFDTVWVTPDTTHYPGLQIFPGTYPALTGVATPTPAPTVSTTQPATTPASTATPQPAPAPLASFVATQPKAFSSVGRPVGGAPLVVHISPPISAAGSGSGNNGPDGQGDGEQQAGNAPASSQQAERGNEDRSKDSDVTIGDPELDQAICVTDNGMAVACSG